MVVTTAHRGVFVGKTMDPGADPIVLTHCRMIVYWDASSHGVLGVAARPIGPQSRVSPAVERAVLRNVTGVFEASDKAAASWEDEPWS